MRTKPYLLATLAVILLGTKLAIAQTEPLPPPEIQSSPLPSPEPPPILPSQQETIRQLIEKEVKESGDIRDQVDEQVNDAFGWTMALLNVLIAVLITIPIGTGFVLWWLRQSVIDRLVNDTKKQFQEETERLIKQELEQAVSVKLQNQVEEFELELKQLRADFEQRLASLYQDAENNKANVVRELEQLLAGVGQDERVSPPVSKRLQELTDQLESIRAERGSVSFSAYDYLREADAFYLGRRFDDAITSYENALALNPNLIEAWMGLAKTLRRMGRYTEAIAANEEVIKRQPQNPWGWFGKGYALADMQQYDAALAAYDAAIQSDPQHTTFWKHKGYALTKLQQYEAALECFDKGLRLNPHSAGTYYRKAYCYSVQHQLDRAVECLKEAICLRPDYRERMQHDPDFAAVRSVESFQRLLAATV